MTTDSMNISHMGSLKEKRPLGPILRKHEEESTSVSSRPSKPHRRSDTQGSRATVLTASSSLSGETELSDKQISYGERSNMSDSIDEESVSQHTQQQEEHQQLGVKRRDEQHTTSYSTDPEQPKSDDDAGGEGIEVGADTEDGIFQQVIGGVSWSNLLSPTGVMEASSNRPPMPEEGRALYVEEKKEDDVRRSARLSTMTKADVGNSALQEEEAIFRFDQLLGLVMMGDPNADDEVSPPNPQPLEDETIKRKAYFMKEKRGNCCDGCDRSTKRMLLCALVALVLLVAIVIPWVSHNANQKAAASLAIRTQSPTTSMSPSVSIMPSDRPTESPTSNPTMSSMPTATPSGRPSQIPSISQIPSLIPSEAPSTSKEPSNNPSETPSHEPSTSMMPSYSTISPDYAFKVRLQWQQSYFWQEEKVERWWCLECVSCQSYGGVRKTTNFSSRDVARTVSLINLLSFCFLQGDGWEHGCRSHGTGNEGACRPGDSIWIRDCRGDRGNRFNVLENRQSGFMLRIASTDLCVTRERRRWLKLDQCDRNRMDQQFVPWENYDKFELRPLAYKGWGEREADCVSQLHHPKQDELVSLRNCRLCRIYETRYWQVYMD